MIDKFVSIKTVFAKIYRDLNINYEISEGDMLEWSSEALAMIGAFSQYEQVTVYLELEHSKVKLPCGFDKLVDINYCGNPLYWSKNTERCKYECTACDIKDECGLGFTFYIQNTQLITNIDQANLGKTISLTYLGTPTDEDGYPLIPDNVYYLKALAAYITFMLDKQEWRKGKLPDKVLEKSETDWLFYVNSARGAANMPNIAQLENLKNIMRRLLPITNDYKRGFKNFNKEEKLNMQQWRTQRYSTRG